MREQKRSRARRSDARGRTLALALGALLALGLGCVALFAGPPPAQAQSTALAASTPLACDTYIASRHVYDCAGLLTPTEISALEAKAAAVTRAGAPVVVRLQVKDATYDQTLTDAANLMARWNVESRPGAKDGLVILLNLKSGDLRHGQVALYAGKTLVNGPLPQDELNRIYQDVMLPDLSAGRTASGIGAALDAVAADLRAGGPPARTAARAIGTVPYNIVAALVALLGLAMGLRLWRATRAEPPLPVGVPTTTPPVTLTPAIAGALLTGQVGAPQMEATILDFARRGLLTLEPLTPKRAQIRLLGDGQGLADYEQFLWLALEHEAQDGVIPPQRLAKVATGWAAASATLRRDLLARGWLDPDLNRKRAPYIILAVGAFALTLAGIIIGAIAEQVWPFIGVALSLLAGVIGVFGAASIPRVTSAGVAAGQAARDYLAGIAALGADGAVSEALPWLVATGQAGAYRQRLLREADDPTTTLAAIYPYWLLVHTSMAPATSPGAVAGASGAAAGGAGAGGAF